MFVVASSFIAVLISINVLGMGLRRLVDSRRNGDRRPKLGVKWPKT